MLDVTAANGRVFKWVAPDSTGSRGNFIAAQLLITPKQRRMITLGGDLRLGKNRTLSIDGAMSDNDINLYSSRNKSNDKGVAARVKYVQSDYLSTDTLRGWKSDSRFDYEYTSKYSNYYRIYG